MIRYWKRFVLILGIGTMFVFIAQLVTRNFYVAASVEYTVEAARQDSLQRTRQAFVSRIATLESPPRLREAGTRLGLAPLPLENFMLMEAER